MYIKKFFKYLKNSPSILRYSIFYYIFWRLFLFIIAFFAPFVVNRWGNRFPYVEEQLISTKLPYWLWSWGNFDGVHYLKIAKDFYSAYYTQTFFPLYPMLTRLISLILFNNYFLAAFIISNLSLIGFIFIFCKLLILDGFKEKLKWILLFLFIFPTSFYFGGIYSESLFLLLLISSLYCARRKKWLLAGLLGGLASATRLFGLFLIVPLIYEWIIQYRDSKKSQKQLLNLMTLILIPLGLVSYMVYLYFQFNDPLLFWHAQPAFGAARSGGWIVNPFQVVYRYLKILFTVSLISIGFWNALFEFVSLIFVSWILIIGHIRRLRPSYLMFSWISLIVPSLTGTLSSLPRYVLIIFPIYIILGTLKSFKIKIILSLVFLVLLLISALLFTRGYWVA